MVSLHYIPTENKKATLISGNRCGHNPLQPRGFSAPSHQKRRPPILERAKVHLGNLYIYPLRAYVQSSLLYIPDKVTKRGIYRKKRSEIREAITHTIGQAILNTLNLKTWVLGYPEGKGFHYYSMMYFSRSLNVSYHQVKMVFKALRDAGYINVTERWKQQADGSRKALNPVISVNPKFLLDLGIDEQELKKALHAEGKEERESALDKLIAAYQAKVAKAKADKAMQRKAKRQRLKAKDDVGSNTPHVAPHVVEVLEPVKTSSPETVASWLKQMGYPSKHKPPH